MSAVPHSYQIESVEKVNNAPMVGRICELSNKGASGIQADERILLFDPENHRLTIEVKPFNGNVPVVKNTLRVAFTIRSPYETEVFLTLQLN